MVNFLYLAGIIAKFDTTMSEHLCKIQTLTQNNITHYLGNKRLNQIVKMTDAMSKIMLSKVGNVKHYSIILNTTLENGK